METLRWRGELIPPDYRVEIFGGLGSAFLVGILVVFRDSIGKGFKRLFGKTEKETPPQLPPPPPTINIYNTPPQLPEPKNDPHKEITAKDTTPPTFIPPSSSVDFVSRRDEKGRDMLELLTAALKPQNNKLVALHGAGGIGKTTLASETARALTEEYEGRVIWISAENKNFIFETLLDEIARWLKRDDLLRMWTEDKREEVKRALSLLPALVVLDNFETVPDGEQRLCSAFLLNDSPCPALITTRQPVENAHNIPVRRMREDEASEFLQRLIEQKRFEKRFTEDVCRKTMQAAERNPLLMKWVVGQIARAERIKDVFDDLARGKDDASERIFDRSFNLAQIGDDGRAVMLALSLFTPSASRASLAEVAGLGGNRERLSKAVGALADLWLIDTTPDGERLMIEGLTKDLAYSRLLKRADADEYRSRFIDYFLRYAKAHSKPKPEDYDQLEPEKDNLLGAIDRAFDSSDWETVMRLMDCY